MQAGKRFAVVQDPGQHVVFSSILLHFSVRVAASAVAQEAARPTAAAAQVENTVAEPV